MELDNQITLKWSDLVHIGELEYDNQNEQGVYLWGFTIDGTFIPYYVGIAFNIKYRMFEHINSIIGGHYTIHHKNSLARFKDYKNTVAKAENSSGKLYSPDWPAKYKTFIDQRKILQPHIDYMVDNFTFTYASTVEYNLYKGDLEAIEKICINQLGKENLWNHRAGISGKFIIQHTGNPIIVGLFKQNI